MATYRAVNGILSAVKYYLEARMPAQLDGVSSSATVKVLSSIDLKNDPVGHAVGIYLHRISVDPFGRNRYIPPDTDNSAPRPETPVNLHILIIGWSATSLAESALVAWAMQQIGSALQLGESEIGAADPNGWGAADVVQVTAEQMNTEDLLRIWEGLPRNYMLSSPYLVKTLRLAPEQAQKSHKSVDTLVFESGTHSGEDTTP